ncbi:MAG TPA: choice-of-anchor D domain-containing protein [Candidatus Binatia bacterium]|nr:choice-of-anchor D domain-containing protein [Candidatus Binatia bacterium]
MFRKLFVAAALAAICVLLSTAGAQTFSGVLTQHNDNSRTGQNLLETTLTPTNVTSSTFGKVFSFAVDGQIYAQPLWVPSVTIGGVLHDVVYVATEYNSVYAFDAEPDLPGHSAAALWHRSFNNVAKGIVPVPCGSDGSSTDISCNVFPWYGITGTPVIDPVTKTMFLVVRTQETTNGVSNYYQRLHAISIVTGADKSGSPVVISGQVPGTGAGSSGGFVAYDPLADIQRVGLTLSNGTIYIGWAGAAHGWIMAYNETTLKQTGIFNTAPNAVLGGVWQTGNGFAVDSSGNIYASVGDATFDANTGGVDYGDTLLELNSSLQVENYFTPKDEGCRTYQTNDLDLGSAGPLLLPTQGGKVANEILVSGKSGTGINNTTGCDTSDLYLLNRADLGGFTSSDSQVLEELTDPPGGQAQGFWSNPAFWQGTENAGGTSGTSYVYMAGTSLAGNGNIGGALDQYPINGVSGSGETALLNTAPSAQTTNTFPQGATPSVSSNGTKNGIVWAIERADSLDQQPGDTAAVLYAYNADNVSTMLYNSSQMTNGRDQAGCANKFQTPTIANGRVYVGTQTQLDIYGLLSVPPPTEGIYATPICYTWTTPVQIGQKSPAHSFTLKNYGTAAITISSILLTGPNSGDFSKSLSNKCGKTLAAGASCTVSTAFAPSTGLPEMAYITITDSAAGSPHNIRLVGTGESPTVNITPPFVAFGQQDINIASAPQVVTVANSSGIPVTISSITITGTNATMFSQTNNCPASLQVNANCTINVVFEPTTTGDLSANLNITDNAQGSPQVVSLTGAGVQPNAVITAPNPPQINFGQVKTGTSSAPQPVSLLNNGGGPLYISSITFTGPNPTEFSQTNNCGSTLASGATCTINVTFSPTTQGTGQAYMNINDNSVPSPQQVSLSGDGT